MQPSNFSEVLSNGIVNKSEFLSSIPNIDSKVLNTTAKQYLSTFVSGQSEDEFLWINVKDDFEQMINTLGKQVNAVDKVKLSKQTKEFHIGKAYNDLSSYFSTLYGSFPNINVQEEVVSFHQRIVATVQV